MIIIKRYKPVACNSLDGGIRMMESKDGEYCKYEDANKLVADTVKATAVTGKLLERAIYVEDIG